MKTEIVTPGDIFNQPRRIDTPLFQRGYVWSKDLQWVPLWEDVVRVAERSLQGHKFSPHFLGAAVLQRRKRGMSRLDYFTVIDGQQRLTTLQLMFRAVQAELEERGYQTLAQQLAPLSTNAPSYRRNAGDEYKVWPANRDRSEFAAAMTWGGRGCPTGEGLFWEAIAYFRGAASEWLGNASGQHSDERARALLRSLTDGLEIAAITLEVSDDGQGIFETLNARGTPLAPIDLVKNYIFQPFDPKGDKAKDLYREYWSVFDSDFWHVESKRGRDGLPISTVFLSSWLSSIALRPVGFESVYGSFKRLSEDGNMAREELLRSLSAAARGYEDLIGASGQSNGELSALELFAYRMEAAGLHYTRPLAIWFLRRRESGFSEFQLEKGVRAFESWLIRHALVGSTPSQTQGAMFETMRAAGEASPDQVGETIENRLLTLSMSASEWPRDKEVREALSSAPVFVKMRRARLRMLLEALEDLARGYPSGSRMAESPTSRGTLSIEHIMPQKWVEHWDDTNGAAYAVERRDALVHTLGNLTLVTRRLNSRLSNAPWKSSRSMVGKRAALDRHSTLLLTRSVVEDNPVAWTNKDIERRTEQMIEGLLGVWPRPNEADPRVW